MPKRTARTESARLEEFEAIRVETRLSAVGRAGAGRRGNGKVGAGREIPRRQVAQCGHALETALDARKSKCAHNQVWPSRFSCDCCGVPPTRTSASVSFALFLRGLGSPSESRAAITFSATRMSTRSSTSSRVAHLQSPIRSSKCARSLFNIN